MPKCNLMFLALALSSAEAGAQVSLSSVTEVQHGKVTGSDSEDISTVYEQFNLEYTPSSRVQVGFRAEIFEALGQDRRILNLSQKYARWTLGSAEVVAGNYYAILGRGLTLRAFELPDVILEDNNFRRRYTPSQDMEGAMVSWTGDRAEVKALVGRPVRADVPPDISGLDRRQDWVTGGELSIRPLAPLKVGGTWVTLHPESLDSNWVWSGLGSVELTPLIELVGIPDVYGSLYGEIANRAGVEEEGRALYLSGDLGGARLGVGFEYKDYDGFSLRTDDLLSSQINDPPSLIREHSAYLLNRSTHVLFPQNERGYQIEATYNQPDLATFTANLSRGRNDIADISRNFEEQYLEMDFDRFYPGFTATAFFDWGKDELRGISRRRVGGFTLGTFTPTDHRFEFDFQLQRAAHPPEGSALFTETYASLSWQHPAGFGAALQADRSSDPVEVDKPETFERETDPVTWWGINLNVQFFGRHDAILFTGKRRGGTACTSGTCYQVLPFNGMEIRLTTHF